MNTFLQDSSGNLSSSRLLMVMTNIIIVGLWAYASIVSIHSGGQMLPIPSEVIALSGLTIFGKVANSTLAERPPVQ